MRSIRISLVCASLALLCGCATQPLTLNIAVNDIYCTETACFCVHDVAARSYSNTLQRIKLEDGIELQFDYFSEPYELEDAILSGTYDGVLSKPWTALRLQKQIGASFERIVDILDPNTNPWLTGIVIVRADSPIQTLDELSGKHLYLGQPDAYEKHQAAQRLLKQKNVHPTNISTNASCSENIGVLLDALADAAVISDYALSADCAVDFANPEDFRIIGQTEKIPLTSLMLDMQKISSANASRVKQALLRQSGPGAAATLLSRGFVEPASWNPPELED